MNKQWILYRTTNLINAKTYIGVHKRTSTSKSKNYLGSGQALKVALKKYGRENFIRFILAEFSCAEDAYAAEAGIVTEDFIKLDNNYNMKCGGKGGRGLRHTDASKAKMSAGNKGKIRTKEFKAKVGAASKGNQYRLGHRHSEETKAKIKASNTRPDNPRNKPVIINGKYYETAKYAAKIENIPHSTLWNRLKNPNPKWSEWRFAKDTL